MALKFTPDEPDVPCSPDLERLQPLDRTKSVLNWSVQISEVNIHNHMSAGPNEHVRALKRSVLLTGNVWNVVVRDKAVNVFMELTERNDHETLHTILMRNIEPGSMLHTDGRPA
ncbi:hypothetical protein RF11_05776 [Thelohanellus kitauei]|uniref:ISXO2-like transposase domain-containing protein n=1 Tax=Thelohanellus kitauei TaxID=669202 RepID=A0A0C2NLQ3_THEKT|nr:hypothetical protein RF11_05776 [Thelohanellus kitauei]